MKKIRDPLVLLYETLKKAMQRVYGEDFLVLDDFPMADRFRKEKRNAANISFLSASSEKGLMREWIPHKEKINEDGTTITVATETLRVEYIIQISFFAEKKAVAQWLSTKWIQYLEEKNELELEGDIWQESMNVFLLYPPPPPDGDMDLWQVNQTWQCSGKLLTEKVVEKVGRMDFKGMINNI